MTKFVDGLLSSKHDLPSFKNHIRDFLVQSKEFSAQVISSGFLSHHHYPYYHVGANQKRSGSSVECQSTRVILIAYHILWFVRTCGANGPLMPPGDWRWISLLFALFSSDFCANCLLMDIFCGLFCASRITRIYMPKRLQPKERGSANGCLPFRGSLPLVNCKMTW